MSSNSPQQAKPVPKDAQVIMSILKDMGVNDYEPQVVTQLLDFTYRYVSTTLEDARVYAQHAGKKVLDSEDVQLAVHMQLDKNFTTPPPRDLLMEVARAKNSTPLPPIKPHCGVRLPPDRYCMTACNFELKPPRKTMIQTKHQTVFTASPQLKPIKRTIQTIPRTVNVSAPKPVIKFSAAGGSTTNIIDGSQWKPVVSNAAMEVDEPPATYIKRKYPDED